MDMSQEVGITVYGAHWCPDCRRSKKFLGEHQIPYNWVDIEADKDGEAYVIQKNGGKRIIPTIEFPDGSILVEPSNAELAQKLSLKTVASHNHYDLIVIGGGPAGLTAALYTAREGIETLVVERAAPGGQAAATQWLDNVPGFSEGVEGGIFADNLSKQATRFGVELLQAQDVVKISRSGNYCAIKTMDGGQYTSRALLLAMGSRYRKLGVPGEDDFNGAGIHFCATCDGPFYKGKPVVVVGGGNSAAEESVFLLNFVTHVTLLVRGDHLTASQVIKEKALTDPNIDVRFNTEVSSFHGSGGKLERIKVVNNRDGSEGMIDTNGAFIFIGQDPNTDFLKGTGVHLNEWGYVVTGHDLVHHVNSSPIPADFHPSLLETSVPGVFAAGDLRSGSTKQVASAAGEGATAALIIREFLKTV